MKMLTHFSIFSGAGGMDIAAEWANFITVGQCELAEYPYNVLCKHWPDVPKWRDIREVTAESFYEKTGLRTVTIIVANTEGGESRQQETGDWREDTCRGSEEVNDVADTTSQRSPAGIADTQGREEGETTEFVNNCEITADNDNKRLQASRENRKCIESCLGLLADGLSTGLAGLRGWWDEEPDIPRVATGVKDRVNKLKCLGNAVVPTQVFPIFDAIRRIELNETTE